MKLGICWLCDKQKKVLQTSVDGHHRWLCKKCENINKYFKTQEGNESTEQQNSNRRILRR